MKLNRPLIIALLLALFTLPLLKAEVRLPALVGDHMVLQRDTPIRIWGWAEPGERVTVQLKTFWILRLPGGHTP